MNVGTLGMKVGNILSKPFQILFGSDERGFATLTASSIILFLSGFPDASIIFAVYSSIFAHSGMQKYSDTSSSEEESPFDEGEMMEIMGQAGEALEEIQEERDEEDN